MERWRRYWGLLAAILALAALSTANAASVPTWSEEVANLPLAPAGTVDLGRGDDGTFPERRPCAPGAGRLDVAPSRRARPALALCAGDRAWPILATSYAASLFGWPIAILYPLLGTSILRLRVAWSLLSGAASISLAWALVRRLAGERRATLAVGAAATSSAAIYLTALFFPYESFIWIWTAAGCVALAPLLAGERSPSTRRAAVAGVAFGLALLTNVKALFLLVPLGVWACRELDVSRRLGWRWLVVALCALPPPAVLLWFAHVDPSSALLGETIGRLGWVRGASSLAAVAREVLNAGTFGGDTGAFLAATATGSIERGGIAVWLVAASIAWCLVAAVRRLAARRGSPVSAGCGMLIGTFVIVSALMYRQGISANYSPIFPVFGVAVASTLFDLGDALGRGIPSIARRSARVEAAAVLCVLAVLSARAVARISAQPALPTAMNVKGLEAVAHAAAEQPDAPVLTVTMLHALTLESLSGERVHSIQAHEYFDACRSRGDVDACVHDRWRALLGRAAGRRFQVLAPSEERALQHDSERAYARAISPALRDEAEAAGLAVRTAHEVRVAGAPVMSLYVVEPR